MESVTIKQFCVDHNIQRISSVRENAKGYPYVTFVNSDNEAENIYFSKNSAEQVQLNDPAGSLADAYIVNTTNADGEERLKITFNSEYQDVESLFGIKAKPAKAKPEANVPA